MAIDALVKPFLALPLFRDLKPLQISEIARHAERIVYRNGDVVTAEGQIADAAILIVSGTCIRRAVDRKQSHEEILPEGSLVAELAMMIEIAHPTTIMARDQVRALRISREKMHELMRQDVDLASHFSSLILKRLHTLATGWPVVATWSQVPAPAAVASESELEFPQGDRARAMQ